jgi:hypothetical protein
MRAPVKFKLLSDGVKHFLTEAVVGFLAGSSSDWGYLSVDLGFILSSKEMFLYHICCFQK